MIIGINGAARSGKGEAAHILNVMFGFKEYSFASPIRNFVIDFLNLQGGLEELDKIKDLPHHLFNGKTPRYVMQTLGTEWGRNTISDNIWVNRCLEMATLEKHAVISDVRFDNEAEAIKSRGGVILQIVRPHSGIKENSHASESGISEKYIDTILLNNADIYDYRNNVVEVVKEFLTTD